MFSYMSPYVCICRLQECSAFSCLVIALYVVFLRCDAYHVFIHCGIDFDLTKFWGDRTTLGFRRPGCECI